MLIAYNEEDLQVPELEITVDMAMDYCKFMNQLMAEIYDLFFQERLRRVLAEMRQMLQLSNSKMVGELVPYRIQNDHKIVWLCASTLHSASFSNRQGFLPGIDPSKTHC